MNIIDNEEIKEYEDMKQRLKEKKKLERGRMRNPLRRFYEIGKGTREREKKMNRERERIIMSFLLQKWL